MSKINDKAIFIREVNAAKPDVLMFLPPTEKESTIAFQMMHYTDNSTPVGGTALGDLYDIILFKMHKGGGGIKDPDRFDAILIEPIQYVTRLIDDDFFGIVAKVTTNSRKHITKLYDSLLSI